MKRVVLTLLILSLTIPCLAKYSGGSGEPNDPYQIATAKDLNDIGNHIEDFNKCFIMTADIDLADYNGLGGRPAFHNIGTFTGFFDGNNKQIMKLTMEGGIFGAALFSVVDGTAAVIKDVIMVDAEVNDFSSGGLACLIGTLREGTVSNCHIINGRVNF